MPRPFSPLFLLFLLFLLCPGVWSYDAPTHKVDLFANRACPALLSYVNVAYLAGTTVELPCRCKPQQVQSVVWFFKTHLGGFNDTRPIADYSGDRPPGPSRVADSGTLQRRFSIRLFSLVIFKASPDDSGVYVCGSGHNDFFYSYDLDIQEARGISFLASVSPETANEDVRAISSASTSSYQVSTRFQPWSVCDRCGVPGEQIRVGLCFVESPHLHVRYRGINRTDASCGSGGVPRAFGRLDQGAMLEVKSCQADCPGKDPQHPDAQRAMTGSDSLPVRVVYMNQPAYRVLTLRCPGARSRMVVAWDRESAPIYRSEHSAASSRLLIDTGNNLVFNPAETRDSGVYHCWLNGRRAAELRLLVYAHLGRRQHVTSHRDFQLAVNTVLTSYAVIVGAFILLQIVRFGSRHLRDTGESHVDSGGPVTSDIELDRMEP